jgi:transcription initiation factor TFIIIB Brf1 subunit/transcription initiation factor TFIIB
MLSNIELCKNCHTSTIVYEERQHIMVCSECGLVSSEKKFEDRDMKELKDIRMKVNTILEECLPLLNIHKNVEKSIRKKMLAIIRVNKEIGKLKNVESVVMTLMVYAIRDLKIPLNKKKINTILRKYINERLLLTDLENLQI